MGRGREGRKQTIPRMLDLPFFLCGGEAGVVEEVDCVEGAGISGKRKRTPVSGARGGGPLINSFIRVYGYDINPD